MQHRDESQPRLTPVSPAPQLRPATPPPRIDAVSVLLRLYRRAQQNQSRWAMAQLDRIAAEVLLHEFTTASDMLGSVAKLFELVADMDQSAVGRLTNSYDGDGRRSNNRVDGRTHAISKRADIDERIGRLLQRGHLRSFILTSGESHVLEALRVGCKACRHSRVGELDAMLREGCTVREVAYWTARLNEPISKSTIHTHRRHVLLPHELGHPNKTKGGVR